MMTTVTPHALSGSQQALIDARLDTIDRMLTGRVPRSDRLAIVREVESQIYESLVDREPSTLSRDDLLDALRRLDPPEAYLPEETFDDGEIPLHRQSYLPTAQKANSRVSDRLDGRIGGVSGLLSFTLALLQIVFFVLLGVGPVSPFQWSSDAALLFVGFASNVFAFVFSIRGRKQGTWPIIGLTFGAISLPVWIVFSGFLFLSFVA